MRKILQAAYGIAAGAALFIAPMRADAAIDFTGSLGSLAAKVTFDVVLGTNLQVTLTNISLADVMVPADVLTGVYFDISGAAVTLTRVSAVLPVGSTVFYDPDGQPAGGVVGGEFAYKAGLAGAAGAATKGISSSGLGLFGAGDLFPGPQLDAPNSPDGLQYGIISAGDNIGTGNPAILDGGATSGTGGLIKNSVVFRLGNLPAGFDLARIGNVNFQYGTDLSEPHFGGGPPPPDTCSNGATNFPQCNNQTTDTPEPMSMAVLGVGLLGLGVARARRRAR